VGDQVRARGDRSADGAEVTATKSSPEHSLYLPALLTRSMQVLSTLNVHDLLTKKNVVIKITPDSELHKLPPEMAQMMAKRFKGAAGAAMASASNGSTLRDQ